MEEMMRKSVKLLSALCLSAMCFTACNEEGDYHDEKCGNGFLDAEELCDPGILPTQEGHCVEDCNDNDPCTSDTLSGSPQTCDAQCKHEKLENCQSLKEDGQACSENTECKSAHCQDNVCVSPKKELGEHCTDDAQCESGFCEAEQCSVPKLGLGESCTLGAQCESGHCVDLICVTAPKANGEYCAQDKECLSGRCIDDLCASHFEFPPRGNLADNAECQTSAQCHSLACVQGKCAADGCAIYTNDACAAQEICVLETDPEQKKLVRICVNQGPNQEGQSCLSDHDCAANLGCNTIKQCAPYCEEHDNQDDTCGADKVCVKENGPNGMCTTACTPGPNDSCGEGKTCHIRLSSVDKGACHVAGDIANTDSCNNMVHCERGNICWTTNRLNDHLICLEYCRSASDCSGNMECDQFFDKPNSTLGLCRPKACNTAFDCDSQVCIDNVCLEGCSSILDNTSCNEKNNCLAYNSMSQDNALVYACTKVGPLTEGSPCTKYSECGKGLVCGPSLHCQKICTKDGTECSNGQSCMLWASQTNKGTCETPCVPGATDTCIDPLKCSPGSEDVDAGFCEVMGSFDTGLPIKLGEPCEYDADCKKGAACAATSSTKPQRICLTMCRTDANPTSCPANNTCEPYRPDSSSSLGVCRPNDGIIIDPDTPTIPEPVEPPTLKSNGQACTSGAECISQTCDLNTKLCKGSCELYKPNQCETGKVCIIESGSGAICKPIASYPKDEGTTCMADNKCKDGLYCGMEESCRIPCTLGSTCAKEKHICAPAVPGADRGLCYDACDPISFDVCGILGTYNYCEPMLGDNTKGYCLMWTDQGDPEYSIPPAGSPLNASCSVNADCDHGLGCQIKAAGSNAMACLRYCNVDANQCAEGYYCRAIKSGQKLGVCREFTQLTHGQTCSQNKQCNSGLCTDNKCVGDCALLNNNSCGAGKNCQPDQTKGSRCEIAGTKKEGQVCSATQRCAMNLACGNDGLCHSFCRLKTNDCGTLHCIGTELSTTQGLCYNNCSPLSVSCSAKNTCEPLEHSPTQGVCQAMSTDGSGGVLAKTEGQSCSLHADCAPTLGCFPQSASQTNTQCLSYCDMKAPALCKEGYVCERVKANYDLGVCRQDTLPPIDASDIEDGKPCRESKQCLSQVCKKNICLQRCNPYLITDACPSTERCTDFLVSSQTVHVCDKIYENRPVGAGCGRNAQCARGLQCHQGFCTSLCNLESPSCAGSASCTKIANTLPTDNYGICQAKACNLGMYNFQNPTTDDVCPANFKCAKTSSSLDTGLCIHNNPSAIMYHEVGGNSSCYSEQECPMGAGCEDGDDGYFYCFGLCRTDIPDTCPSKTKCIPSGTSTLGWCVPQ